jgi:hypothetical protein
VINTKYYPIASKSLQQIVQEKSMPLTSLQTKPFTLRVVCLVPSCTPCQDNNLSLNVSKAKELIVDYRKWRGEHIHIHIDRAVVERVKSFKFICAYITKELTWSTHTHTVVKRARQHLFPFRRPSDPQKVIQLHH